MGEMSACRRVKMLPVFRHEVAHHPAVVEEKIADRCLHRAPIVYPTSSMRFRNMWLLAGSTTLQRLLSLA
jgi:hypothetical protein